MPRRLPHTQRGRPTTILGKVLYWINSLLLLLNQYCRTIKGLRRCRRTQKAAAEVGEPAGGSPWKHGICFRSKENSWSENNRTFRKNTAVPPSLPAGLTLSVSLTARRTLSGLKCLLYNPLLLSVVPSTYQNCFTLDLTDRSLWLLWVQAEEKKKVTEGFKSILSYCFVLSDFQKVEGYVVYKWWARVSFLMNF